MANIFRHLSGAPNIFRHPVAKYGKVEEFVDARASGAENVAVLVCTTLGRLPGFFSASIDSFDCVERKATSSCS